MRHLGRNSAGSSAAPACVPPPSKTVSDCRQPPKSCNLYISMGESRVNIFWGSTGPPSVHTLLTTMRYVSQVERNPLDNVNVIACLEFQQADCRGAECTPQSPAACRAASLFTLQCGSDDGASNSSSLTTVAGMSAAQGTRRQALHRNGDSCLQTLMHVESGCCIASRAAGPSRAHLPVPHHHTPVTQQLRALARVCCSTAR